ncbi:MAG TPA: OsmC family protein [Allosphingosinicella sp.]|nr:OsmC family protein [Allosphingosinicella sp.]
MGEHRATISWGSDGEFRSGRYSRAHEWRFDGGAVVRGSSSPSVVPEPMSDASAVDPEEALVASASSCHMLWFLSLAQQAGLDVRSYRDQAVGSIGRDERGRVAITRIALRPEIVFAARQPGKEELDALHHEAHDKCFIANSLRCEIVVEPGGAGGS